MQGGGERKTFLPLILTGLDNEDFLIGGK